ncbi:MAG: hypothetical protein ACYC1M_00205 [Armatimonadota bacterium]
MAFDPEKHLIKIQGNRSYLPVSARLVWFREQHPNWRIETQLQQLDVESGLAIFRASIIDDTDRVISTGTKMETRVGFPDYVEKAETGAIGRALAVAGFGTQFAPELGDEAVRTGEGSAVCEECGAPMTDAQIKLSQGKLNRTICGNCQKRLPAGK